MDDYSLSSISGIYDKYSGKSVEVKDDGEFSNGSLDFDGYLKLLVAQMSNQDFNDPMSDSDLLNQMAQYSMMEGIKNMTQQSGISYAASLVGKVVTVSEDGKLYHTGTVQAVTIDKGKPSVVVDGMTFSSSMITDVVTDEAYAELKNFLGKTVKLKGSGEDAKTGVVEGIVFKNGQGFVSIGGDPYAIWELEIVETDQSEKTDTEKTDDENKTEEAGDKTENGDEAAEENTDDTVIGSAAVNEGTAAYGTRSQALADIFMKELDRAEETAETSSDLPEESLAELEELVKTAYVQVPEYSAAFYAQDTEIPLSSYTDGSAYFGDNNTDELQSISADEYNKSRGITADTDSDNSNSLYDSSSGSWMGTTASQAGWTSSDFSSTNTSPWGSKEKGVTGPPYGMINGSDTPQRISVEKYPEEAAIADSYGTRMYDIRFINNREITSRIARGSVIGRMSNGMGVTEIGFSGVGKLGEVVTFENGQQRVEIMLRSGKSSWVYTSGNYTLDQICSSNMTSEMFSKLSPAEVAIRHHSRVDLVETTSAASLLA